VIDLYCRLYSAECFWAQESGAKLPTSTEEKRYQPLCSLSLALVISYLSAREANTVLYASTVT